MSDKHAYLIMAHNQPELLKCLLKALDYEKNDIYLHLDQKMRGCDERELRMQVRRGALYILPERLDVKWGAFSQIECELYLLAEATKKEYAYYHLMSGVDFPLKTQKEIHSFFRRNSGVEYVQFQAKNIDANVKKRVSKHHFLTKRKGTKNLAERILGKVLGILQLPIDRTRYLDITFQKGANWFSITDSLARFVVSQKSFIYRTFRHALCGDEMFLQTIVYNSDYKNRVVGDNYCDNYSNILYHIDWNRGSPYEFTGKDYDMLMASDMLFARKFNWDKDSQIIVRLLSVVGDGEQ